MMSAQLIQAADSIASGIDPIGRDVISRATPLLVKINSEYLLDAVSDAGAGYLITEFTVGRMASSINRNLLESLITRVWKDGYTYSDRVWNLKDDWLERIKTIVSAGISQGRDPVKIARDIQVYTADGKIALVKRWGSAISGDLAKRIPRNIDWRAARLVRSELYASLQDASAQAGDMNPGCTGEYDWRLSAARESWPCECESLAAGSPYMKDAIPTYPHPHCHPDGTLIATIRGDVPIEKIIPGDVVISHDGSLNSVSARWSSIYSGEIITIKTKRGEIKATPEHQLLTSQGWRSAKLFKNGDNLSGIFTGFIGFPLIESESNNSPSKRSKEYGFFRILYLLDPAGMPSTAIDFNGELYILESQINVVSSNSEVWNGPFPIGFEKVIHNSFIGRHERAFVRFSDSTSVFIRLNLSSNGIVCGGYAQIPSGLITSNHSIGDPRNRESKTYEIAIDDGSRHSENLRYSVYREILFGEESREFHNVKINSSTHDPIVHVSCEQFNGIVYNLTVEKKNSYIANGFASHNCACSLVPRLRDRATFVSDLRRFARGDSVDYLDKWYSEKYKSGS